MVFILSPIELTDTAKMAEQEQTLTIQQAIDLAVQHHKAGRISDAETIYQQILQTDPDQPIVLHLLGVIAHQTGKNNLAVDLITKALRLRPDYVDAHNNLGNALKDLGRLDEAIASYHKALALKSDYAESYSNLGLALQDLGKLEEAIVSYRKALAINPNLTEAHNNLGLALQELGKPEEAVASHYKALDLNQDLAGTHYNLHALSLDPDDLSPSIKCMERAVEIDPSNTNYRFVLGMLWDYSGDAQKAETHFDRVENGASFYRAKLDAWRHIKSANNKVPPIIGSSIQAFKLGIDAAVVEGLVLEFGVRFGTSIRQIASLVKQDVHGFDSFQGLPETWHNVPKGSYSTEGVIPSVPENVILHDGWFEETLPEFIKKHPGPVRFMNIDCDIYSSTKTVLEFFAKQIIPGTVIVFDEYIGNSDWREDEFKAFQEAVLKHGWEYEYLCFSFMTKQVAVRIN